MDYRSRPQRQSPSDAMVLRSSSRSGSEDSMDIERWYYVARKVGFRWKFFVWRKQFWRLRANRLLMLHWWQTWPDNVGTEIYELAGGCAVRLQRIEPTPRLRFEPTPNIDWFEEEFGHHRSGGLEDDFLLIWQARQEIFGWHVCIDSRLPLLTRNIWVPRNGLRH